MGPQLFNSQRRDRRYLRSSLSSSSSSSSSSNSCEHALYSGAALVGWGAPFVRYLDNSIDFTWFYSVTSGVTASNVKCEEVFEYFLSLSKAGWCFFVLRNSVIFMSCYLMDRNVTPSRQFPTWPTDEQLNKGPPNSTSPHLHPALPPRLW